MTETPEHRRWRNARIVIVLVAALWAASLGLCIARGGWRGTVIAIISLALLAFTLNGARGRLSTPRPPKFPADRGENRRGD